MRLALRSSLSMKRESWRTILALSMRFEETGVFGGGEEGRWKRGGEEGGIER